MSPSIASAVSIMEVILINVTLSGDNAVVIAMVAHGLPAQRRRRVVLWGGALAIAMQAAFALVVARLLLVPGLRLLGGILLLGIAGKLLQEEAGEEDGGEVEAAPGARGPIVRIALANLAMSFDNVVAVASVCRSDPLKMGLGLAVSGLILFACGAAIVGLMDRSRWIVYAGASVLAATAAGMMWHDLAAAWSRSVPESWGLGIGGSAGWEARSALTAMILLGVLARHGLERPAGPLPEAGGLAAFGAGRHPDLADGPSIAKAGAGRVQPSWSHPRWSA